MSIFGSDNDDVKNSIEFFNNLSNEDKIRIVSDLHPLIFQQNRQQPAVSAIVKNSKRHIQAQFHRNRKQADGLWAG